MFVFGDGWLARAKRASALYQPSGVNLLPSTSKITNCCTSSFAVWAEALAHAAGPALAANPMTNKNNDFILVFALFKVVGTYEVGVCHLVSQEGPYKWAGQMVLLAGQTLFHEQHPGGFFFSSRRRHTRFDCDWSSDVCSSD